MKKELSISLSVLFLLLTSLCGCSQKQSVSTFDPAPFGDSPSKLTLCFDLRNDTSPKTGLLLKLNQEEVHKMNTVAFPFNSTDVSQKADIFSTWGSYGSTTLVSFYTLPTNKGNYDLAITPTWGPSPDEWNDNIEDLSPTNSIFFLQYGLTRHFIYKYPEKDLNRNQWLQNLAGIKTTDVDGIAVTLPFGSTGREIKRTDKTTIPSPTILGETKYFPAGNQLTNEKMIYIKYELPANKNQQLFVEQLIKFIVSMIPIFIQFVILLLRKPDQKKKARIIIWIFAGIQFLVICALVYLAYENWQETTVKALSDLMTAIVTGVLSGIILWKEKTSATPNS